MGETLRRGPRHEIKLRNIEQDSDIEVQEHLDELDRLLAALVEKSGDLSSQQKRNLRTQVQQALSALGLKSLEDYEGFLAIHERLHRKMTDLPAPAGYPEKEVFGHRLAQLSRNAGEALPGVPQNPLATEVAQYSQGDWARLEGRGGQDITEYLYQLGKIISSEFAYTATFDETDAIEVNDEWRVENGRHRAMALRGLGQEYVESQDIDHWVTVRREE